MASFNKIGFLAASTGNAQGIGEYVRQLDAAGIPAVVFCNDGTTGISDAMELIRQGSAVKHVMGYRVVRPHANLPVEHFSVPAYHLAPAQAAAAHWDMLKPEISPFVVEHKAHIWVFPVNEVRAKVSEGDVQFNNMNAWDWMGEFCFELAQLMNTDGFKACLPQANSGEPRIQDTDGIDDWRQPGMVKFLGLCARRPDQCAVGLHEYSWNIDDIMDGFPFKVGRFQFLFQTCDALSIPRPNVIIGEWGWEKGNVPPPKLAVDHIDQVMQVYARYANILGAGIWYLGRYQDNIHNKTQKLIEPVREYTLQARFPDPEPAPAFAIPPISGGPEPGESGPPPGGELGPTPEPDAKSKAAPAGSARTLFDLQFTGYGERDNIGEPAWWDRGNVQVPIVDGRRLQYWEAEGDNNFADGQPWNRFGHPEGRVMWVDDPHKPAVLGNHDRVFLNEQGRTYHLFSGVPFHVRYWLEEALEVPGEIQYTIEMVGDWVFVRDGQKVPKSDPEHGRVEFFAGNAGKDEWLIPALMGKSTLTKTIAVEAGTLDVGFGVLTVWAAGSGKQANGCFIQRVTATYIPERVEGETGRDDAPGAMSAPSAPETVAVAEAVLSVHVIRPQQPEANGLRLRITGREGAGEQALEQITIPLPSGASQIDLEFLRVSEALPGEAEPDGRELGLVKIISPTFDLLEYLRGDGRAYMVRSEQTGNQELIFSQIDGDRFYTCKGEFFWQGQLVCNWEEMWLEGEHIMRGTDTSPDAQRYYTLREDGRYGSRWIGRTMSAGQATDSRPHVQFYAKADCRKLSQNSGNAHNQIEVIRHHDQITFFSGITCANVLELKWTPGNEVYFYMRQVGLVGWQGLRDGMTPTFNAVSEWLPPDRPLPPRMVIPCLDRT